MRRTFDELLRQEQDAVTPQMRKEAAERRLADERSLREADERHREERRIARLEEREEREAARVERRAIKKAARAARRALLRHGAWPRRTVIGWTGSGGKDAPSTPHQALRLGWELEDRSTFTAFGLKVYPPPPGGIRRAGLPREPSWRDLEMLARMIARHAA
jgi:hypothetical protein